MYATAYIKISIVIFMDLLCFCVSVLYDNHDVVLIIYLLDLRWRHARCFTRKSLLPELQELASSKALQQLALTVSTCLFVFYWKSPRKRAPVIRLRDLIQPDSVHNINVQASTNMLYLNNKIGPEDAHKMWKVETWTNGMDMRWLGFVPRLKTSCVVLSATLP